MLNALCTTYLARRFYIYNGMYVYHCLYNMTGNVQDLRWPHETNEKDQETIRSDSKTVRK